MLAVNLLALAFAISALVQVRSLRRALEQLAARLPPAVGWREAPPAPPPSGPPSDPSAARPSPQVPEPVGPLPDRDDVARPPRPATFRFAEHDEDDVRPGPPAGPAAVAPPATPPQPGLTPDRAPGPSAEAGRPAASGPSFEERLGARWSVWVGGVALGLGGLFLVKYSVEQRLVGPGARVVLGLLFALALVGAAEILRRREPTGAVAGVSAAHIPGVLAAAGTIAAFGTVYAAHALYGFVGPAMAFVALGAIGLGAMVWSALYGPALAGLGLLGALAAPILVGSDAPHPWFAVVYLAVVVGSADGLARLRRWDWLAMSAGVGALIWCVPLALGSGSDVHPEQVHIALQTLLASALLTAPGLPAKRRSDRLASRVLGVLALGGAASLLFRGEARFAFAALEASLLAGAALWRPSAAPAATAAALLAVVALTSWPAESGVPFPPATFLAWLPLAADPGRFTTMLGAFVGGLFAVGAAAVSRPGRVGAVGAAYLAAAGVIGPLVALAIGDRRIAGFDASPFFAAAAALLALGFTALCEVAERRSTASRDAAAVIGLEAAAAGAVAALALGLTFALSHGTLTVALALAAAGAAFVTTRRPYGSLRGAVAVLAGFVLVRTVLYPTVVEGDIGPWPVFNWLLWGYGAPALAFAAAARFLGARKPDDPVAAFVSGVAVLFAALLVGFELRHAVNGGDILRPHLGLVEAGLQTTAALGFSFATAQVDARRPSPVMRGASLVFGFGAVAFAAATLGLVCNPALDGEAVEGGAALNTLLPAYLVPAVASALLARHARAMRRPSALGLASGAVAVLLAFLYATLEVRRLFVGPDLDIAAFPVGSAESWTYSATWLLLGVAALCYGLWQNSLAARAASAVLIAGSAAKVFLFDMAGTTGIWRALSFIALGAVLIGIGLVYQRVLRRPAPA